jgi:three-Cys-motif partner protein
MSESFFDEQSEQSAIKAALVASYFPAFMRVIGSVQKRFGGDRIAYIDLFAGPGRYKNGAQSTPVKIIEQAIADTDMRQRLVAIFNDVDEDNVRSLEATLKALPGYNTLKYKPQIRHGEVGEGVAAQFEQMRLVPTLFFVDPWGYKGMTLRLINSVLRNWGCDCFFFFNYSRVNAGIGNPVVEQHMNDLFGQARADSLRARFRDRLLEPHEREAFIIDEMCLALADMGGKYVLPFRFHSKLGTRTTHHLFFVSKDFKGYEIMKDIMHSHCTGTQAGPVNFAYNPADQRQPKLFGFLSPLSELGPMLLRDFAGRTVGIREIYESHSVGRPFVLKEYREVLCGLEGDGRLVVDPPCPPRRQGTLAPHAKIRIPKA